jgi:hypothetical protein
LNSFASLDLQGFGFNIPDNATIENITVRVRRFKNGKTSNGDYFLSVMQRVAIPYGVHWTKNDIYPGKLYPDTETVYVFSQSGDGNDGGFFHDQAYQWTPAMINHPYFGVRNDSYPPIGKGPVVVYYDLVDITVDYSMA